MGCRPELNNIGQYNSLTPTPTIMMTDDELQAVVDEKMKSLRRVRAKREELNQKVRKLKDELEEIMDPGCYVGEVIKMMDREKVLVKVSHTIFPVCV